MGKRIIGILAALALMAPADSGIAASKSPKLAKCDGKQRRPANPYGSILPSVDPLGGTSTPAVQPSERKSVEVFPGNAPEAPKPAKPDGRSERQVPPISSLSPSTSNQSC
jgi:hypothetical protein